MQIFKNAILSLNILFVKCHITILKKIIYKFIFLILCIKYFRNYYKTFESNIAITFFIINEHKSHEFEYKNFLAECEYFLIVQDIGRV